MVAARQLAPNALRAARHHASARVIYAAVALFRRRDRGIEPGLLLTKRTAGGEDTGEPTFLGAVMLDLEDAAEGMSKEAACAYVFDRLMQTSDEDLHALVEEADRELARRRIPRIDGTLVALGVV